MYSFYYKEAVLLLEEDNAIYRYLLMNTNTVMHSVIAETLWTSIPSLVFLYNTSNLATNEEPYSQFVHELDEIFDQ